MANLADEPLLGRIQDWAERSEERIERQPLTALAIAAMAGFALGGGLRSKTGWAAMAFVGRLLIREAGMSLWTGMINPSGPHRRAGRPAASEAVFE